MNRDDKPQLRYMTPNQVVAYNLRAARTYRGLSQKQAAELLEPYLGTRWSKATFSTVERSIDGKRVKQFSADEITAFSRAFDLPISWFLIPPEEHPLGLLPKITPPSVASEEQLISREEMLSLNADLRPLVGRIFHLADLHDWWYLRSLTLLGLSAVEVLQTFHATPGLLTGSEARDVKPTLRVLRDALEEELREIEESEPDQYRAQQDELRRQLEEEE